mmetsp:Transcript_62361/g.141040  ORF Transcript_62361/g.141040 Transcript_62361/m.141040 type:complete len:171 (-) Transcript_62361:217-729(-)
MKAFTSTLPIILSICAWSGYSWSPEQKVKARKHPRIETNLDRRSFSVVALGTLLVAPASAFASYSPWLSDYVRGDLISPGSEPISAQQARPDKLDLNSAPIQEYKPLAGMYPHAAGKIASNGPYNDVKDIYKIQGLSKRDIELFKKNENLFTVLPPGRMFVERLNSRQSQ